MVFGILGPGRLGKSLAILLEQAGSTVVLQRDPVFPSGVDVVLLTVPDSQIRAAAAALPRGPVVLHCSGASVVDVLRPHDPAGSLHPLMTFPGPQIAIPDLRGVSCAIAGDPDAIQAATTVARRLKMRPLLIEGDRRLYHAAAVLAGNFATVLLADAARLLQAAGVPPERTAAALLPLAVASLQNAADDPAGSLTGPAARGDTGTIAMHLDALREHGLDDVEDVYRVLTKRAAMLAESSSTGQ